LVAIGVLVILSCVMAFAWKGIPIGMAVVGILAVAAWFTSPYLEGRVRHGQWEFQQYVGEHRPTSIGLRLDWWRQSVHYWRAAPIIGYGTGSVEEVFKRGAAERGIAGPQFVTTDPHSQIMAMAVQFGIVGVVALFAMWLVHVRMFLVSGPIAWFGLVVVIQNIVGCVFNSHIKDFTEGWIYVFGVGVLGGMVQRRQVVWRAITGDCATNRIDVADRGCTPSVLRS
jgi:O-antigen ligase